LAHFHRQISRECVEEALVINQIHIGHGLGAAFVAVDVSASYGADNPDGDGVNWDNSAQWSIKAIEFNPVESTERLGVGKRSCDRDPYLL
jgi:hypothetical protein